MKSAIVSLFLIASACLLSFAESSLAQRAASDKQTISLDGNWEFHQSDGNKSIDASWLPAQVPGDVRFDLLKNKLISDPCYRNNESHFQWIENADWAYRRTFEANPDLFANRRVDPVFLGLDTNAMVFINNRLVLTADNMFRSWRIDAKPFLHPGSNDIRVEFPSPIKLTDTLADDDKTHADTRMPEKSYLRKAAYEYGWDWEPRFVTSGIWQYVYLEEWNKARISDVPIEQPDVRADVIPFDSFPNRVTEARYRQILPSARDANMNMVRL